MKFRIYPRPSELKEISRLIFTTRQFHIRTRCSLSQSSLRIQDRVRRKESIHPYLPPVIITEVDKGMFIASIRSHQLFGVSMRLQNSPEIRAEFKGTAEETEITGKFSYASTFRLRLFALTLVVLAIMTMALILLVNVILGSYDVMIIALGGILISFLMYRSILSEIGTCSEVEGVLLAWINGVFTEAEQANVGPGAINSEGNGAGY